MDSDVVFMATIITLMTLAFVGLFMLTAYILGWAILFVAGMFWGYAWPGFWAAWLLGLAIMIAISAIRWTAGRE